MGLSRYWDARTITSNLFRLAAWIFLRVIPSPRLTLVIPVLYVLYLGTYISGLVTRNTTVVKSEKSDVTITAENNTKVSHEKLDTKAAVPLSPLPHGTLSTLVFSLPTSSLGFRSLVFLLNTLLLLCAADLVTRPAREPASSLIFTRVGAVDPDGAKIVVRWPEVEQGAVRVLWRQAPSTAAFLEAPWKNGPVISLSNETDWVGVTRIGGLWPSTTYEYRLAYPNLTHLPYPEHAISFRTFPDPRLTTGNHFKFVASSCIMPNFPYLPFKGDRIKGFDLLNDYIWPPSNASPPSHTSVEVLGPVPEETASVVQTEPETTKSVSISGTDSPIESTEPGIETSTTTTATEMPLPLETQIVPTEFGILLGDFVYAEVPWYGGNDVEKYRRLYRRAYASPSFRKVYERLPIFNIFDDHEIINNFAGKSNVSTEPFPNASSAYYSYNGQANYDPVIKGGHYYDFRYGDVAFFVLDTRLYRSGESTHEDEKKSMLGEKQLSALHSWLDKVNTTTTFKFIVSSVPFTSLWTHDAQVDSWAAYLEERDALLGVLGTVPNVFVLSGDRHEFAAIEFLGGKVVEFSTSPLSMFYIPIVRTLRSHGKRLVEKWVRKVEVNEIGQEVVKTELEWVPEERVLKYLPLGNYKWSAFEVDTTDRQKPTLKVEVVINGRIEWRHTITGQPVTLKASSAIGTQITRGLKDALDKIGLSPTKWF